MKTAAKVTIKDMLNTNYGINKQKPIKGEWKEINGIFEFIAK